jgi:hypothetical protein
MQYRRALSGRTERPLLAHSIDGAGGVSSKPQYRLTSRKRSEDQGRLIVLYRSSTAALALAGTLTAAVAAQAADDAKYPNWKGQWAQILTPGVGGQNVRFDPTRAFGPAQGAPLTAEYQKVHAASMADQAQGGLGNYPTARCLPGGMPRMMTAAQGNHLHHYRRRRRPHPPGFHRRTRVSGQSRTDLFRVFHRQMDR